VYFLQAMDRQSVSVAIVKGCFKCNALYPKKEKKFFFGISREAQIQDLTMS